MWIKDKWNKLSTNEKLLVGMAIIAFIMVLLRWDKISKEVPDAFKRIFSKQEAN
jgi:hypothetical protein